MGKKRNLELIWQRNPACDNGVQHTCGEETRAWGDAENSLPFSQVTARTFSHLRQIDEMIKKKQEKREERREWVPSSSESHFKGVKEGKREIISARAPVDKPPTVGEADPTDCIFMWSSSSACAALTVYMTPLPWTKAYSSNGLECHIYTKLQIYTEKNCVETNFSQKLRVNFTNIYFIMLQQEHKNTTKVSKNCPYELSTIEFEAKISSLPEKNIFL